MSKPTKNGKGWRIRWFDEAGKRQNKTFKTYKEAEQELLKKRHETYLIKSGRLEKIFEDKTFNDLSVYWLEKVVFAKKSSKDLISIIKSQLLPYFGNYLLKNLSQEQVQGYILLKTKAGVTKKTISNHLTVLISMLNFANDMNWLRVVPKIRKPKISKTKSYNYLKTNEEIVNLLVAAKEFDEMNYYLYAVAVFTGMRAGELAGLHWDDVDFNNRRICVQRSYDSQTKSGEIRYIPILDSLLPILEEMRSKKISKLVFMSKVGTMIYRSARIFQEQFKLIQKSAGFPVIESNGKIIKGYIRFHDLRHTFASHWVMKGGDVYRLQKVLGHQSIEMTQRYSHLSSHVFAEDYSRFNSINL